MSELSERELLLLSNYMYMDISVTQGSIHDTLSALQDENGAFDPALLPAASGDMKTEDVLTVLKEMQASSEEFRSLRVTQAVDQDGIRGACFENTEGDGTVVFRGTGGGYEAWTDNIMGGCQKDTRLQKKASDFLANQCGAYQKLTVAGHSKGGNLAQYVTVVCGDQVDRCVSFDGQGQSRDFILSNTKQVRAAQSKMTSISAHNDFVNILLTSIAGRQIFVENQGNGTEAHSAVRLLTDNTFDPETGEFISFREQAADMRQLKAYLANGVLLLDELPYGISEDIYRTLAGILAGVLSSERSMQFELAKIVESTTRLTKTVIGGTSEGFVVSFPMLSQAKTELEAGEKQLLTVRTAIEDMMGQGNPDLYTKLLIGKTVEKIFTQVTAETVMLQQLNRAVEDIIRYYAQGETAIIDFVKEA